MGNRASLGIVLEHGEGVIQAGTSLKGKVVAKVRFPIRGEKLLLQVYGKEKTCIRSRQERASSAERQLFSVVLTLREFSLGGTVLPGAYTFPFSVRLPASLPSSTQYAMENKSPGFRIQYKMKSWIGRLQTERYITLASAPLPEEKVSVMVQPTAYPIKSLGFTKGSVTVGASVEETHIGRGQLLELNLACRNDSTAEIRRVEIKLNENLEWRSNPREGFGQSRDHVETLVFLNDVDLPGLSKQRKDRKEVRRSAAPDIQTLTYQAIHQDLVSGESKVRLKIPTHARDSYSGTLVKVQHVLEIKLQTGTMVNNPVTRVPIRIGNPALRRQVSQIATPTTPSSLPSIPASPMQPSMLPVVEPRPMVPEAPILAPQPQDEIPIVTAIVVPTDAIESSMVTAEEDIIVLGGDAIVTNGDDSSSLAPMERPPPEAPHHREAPVPVSVDELLREMSRSVNDFDIIAARLQDPAWLRLFQSISPQQFGSIISNVNVEFDQPRVAALLSPHLNGGDCFTCNYAAAAVKNAAEWSRSSMAERVVPLCLDILSGHHLIRAELTEWEQMVTRRFFDEAFAQARASLPQQ